MLLKSVKMNAQNLIYCFCIIFLLALQKLIAECLYYVMNNIITLMSRYITLY